jgi:RNA ligase (TIGR02306 family)
MTEIVRKLATIERISAINPIPEADAIERATIRGWNVVVKKGEHKVDELVIYCEIDSLMPEREEFEFLRPRGFRIRTIKLRGQISQGIIFPLSIIGQYPPPYLPKYEEGFDVTNILGITKYETPIPAELAGQVKGGFPSHSIKTDEERIQNLIDHYEDYKKEEWIATEKVDGTSMTACVFNGEFGISSRNLELKENETNTFWKVARSLDLENQMREYMALNGLQALTLQGELLGEGIQKNKYKIKGQTVKFFRAFDPIKFQFFPFENFLIMMDNMNLETVPIIDKNFKLPENYEDLILYADGKSMLVEGPREGVVFVAKNPVYNDNGRLSFKVISNKFILKHEE